MTSRILALAGSAALLFAAAAPATAASAQPPITWAQQPKFNDYLVCLGPHVYVDFVDPDGDDTKLKVQLVVTHLVGGHLRRTNIQMANSGPSVHGVFFWSDITQHGVDPTLVLYYAFQATDEDGFKSAWKYVGAGC